MEEMLKNLNQHDSKGSLVEAYVHICSSSCRIVGFELVMESREMEELLDDRAGQRGRMNEGRHKIN